MPCRAVVFDMGGVLIDLGPISELFEADPRTEQELWRAWIESPTVRAFEMGHVDAHTFAQAFLAESAAQATVEDFLERLSRWPKGLLPGVAELIGAIPPEITTAVLSNTNALHWETQRDARHMQSMFARSYLSFQLGLAKPDAAMYEHVVADLGFPPSEIVFIDDNQINVDGARSIGINAHLARGVAQTTNVLRRVGVLS